MSIDTLQLNCDQAEKKGLIPFFHELPATLHFKLIKTSEIEFPLLKAQKSLLLNNNFVLRKNNNSFVQVSLWKTSTYFLWSIIKNIISITLSLVTRMKKERKTLQESKSQKKNIKPIFSQLEQSLFMGIVFESQTEKKSNFGSICVLCPLPSREKIIQIIVGGHDLRQPRSGI